MAIASSHLVRANQRAAMMMGCDDVMCCRMTGTC